VLDPFCGCGTAVVAAQKLDRRWIGIDVTYLSITLMRKRIKDSFGDLDYEVVGEPADMGSARALFQTRLPVPVVGARPRRERSPGRR